MYKVGALVAIWVAFPNIYLFMIVHDTYSTILLALVWLGFSLAVFHSLIKNFNLFRYRETSTSLCPHLEWLESWSSSWAPLSAAWSSWASSAWPSSRRWWKRNDLCMVPTVLKNKSITLLVSSWPKWCSRFRRKKGSYKKFILTY